MSSDHFFAENFLKNSEAQKALNRTIEFFTNLKGIATSNFVFFDKEDTDSKYDFYPGIDGVSRLHFMITHNVKENKKLHFKPVDDSVDIEKDHLYLPFTEMELDTLIVEKSFLCLKTALQLAIDIYVKHDKKVTTQHSQAALENLPRCVEDEFDKYIVSPFDFSCLTNNDEINKPSIEDLDFNKDDLVYIFKSFAGDDVQLALKSNERGVQDRYNHWDDLLKTLDTNIDDVLGMNLQGLLNQHYEVKAKEALDAAAKIRKDEFWRAQKAEEQAKLNEQEAEALLDKIVKQEETTAS